MTPAAALEGGKALAAAHCGGMQWSVQHWRQGREWIGVELLGMQGLAAGMPEVCL